MAYKVTLRKKPISKGRYSLYLDIWPPIPHPDTGEQTRRKFLGLYLFIERREIRKKIEINEMMGKDVNNLKSLYKGLNSLTLFQQHHNSETLKIAESIRQKYENQLNKPEIYSDYEKDFVKYFRKLAEKRNDSNRSNWLSSLKYLEEFTGGSLKFSDLSESVLNDFKDYLLSTNSTKSSKTKLSQNSALSYFNKVKATLKQAYQDGILQTDLNARIQPIKAEETRREYLTMDELNKLANTYCNDDNLKRAALFSALTGLRFSDIQKMVWNELEFNPDEGYFLNFSQQKTKGVEVLPISEQAFKILGDPGDPASKVFPELKYSAYHNKHLFQWIGAAGITKNITFHCFRHTYATLQLFAGTDIYTVSKMLGHKDLKTTQVYAKIVDKAKRQAASRIKLDI